MIGSESEFLQIAFKAYDNVRLSSIEEFESDLKRFNYLNTMINRYRMDGDTSRLRLSLNHIVTLSNVFGPSNIASMVRYKIQKENSEIAETMLYFLNLINRTDRLDFSLLNKLDNL